MNSHELLTELRRLTPTQRSAVLTAALAIRAARDAGDTRPAAQIVAHLVHPGARRLVH
jgi:hypothetical protein